MKEDLRAMGRAVVELSGVTKRYGSMTALEALDLAVYEGELLSLLGPSGCGKTTTLNVIAGFAAPDAGRVVIDGEPVHGVHRQAAFVFQNYSLLAWLSAIGNVELAVAAAFPACDGRGWAACRIARTERGNWRFLRSNGGWGEEHPNPSHRFPRRTRSFPSSASRRC